MKELLDTRVMHASDPTDVRLLQRIAARDTGALAELYDRHSRLLFGLILRIVRDRAEAEEILQEAFVRVWTRAETYDAQIGGPLPWIVRVARNCAIDRLRARRVRATVDAPAIDVAAVEAAAPATGIQTPEAAVLMAEQAADADRRAGRPPGGTAAAHRSGLFRGIYSQRARATLRTAAGDRQDAYPRGHDRHAKRLEHAV